MSNMTPPPPYRFAIKTSSLALVFVGLFTFACSTSDLIVGDDSPTLPDGSLPPAPLDDGGGATDSAPTPSDAGSSDADAKTDASSGCAAPATCIPQSEICQTLSGNGNGCSGTDVCCAQTCPQLSPPAPSFCDGGPTAPIYDSSKCIVGYGCAPMACTAGGGQCVGIAPTSCPNGHWGDANKYSCGPGIGSGCCLP